MPRGPPTLISQSVSWVPCVWWNCGFNVCPLPSPPLLSLPSPPPLPLPCLSVFKELLMRLLNAMTMFISLTEILQLILKVWAGSSHMVVT